MTEETLVAPIDEQKALDRGFSPYQSLIVALLALVQFTIILDFMIMSPLGAIIMPALNITAAQFGVAVSAYAFSAGISGVLAAGFADRFDRKRLLLFFYVGFTLGTAALRGGAELSCAAARPYRHRIVRRRDGLHRARHHHRPVSRYTCAAASWASCRPRSRQARCSVSRSGFFSSNRWNWHVCFAALVGLSIVAMAAILVVMRPVNEHLRLKQDQNAFSASGRDGREPRYLLAFSRDDIAGDRRIHDDAVRQRLHRAQSRDRYRASSDHLSGLRPVQHFHGTSGRQGQRRVRQISDLRVRHARCRS